MKINFSIPVTLFDYRESENSLYSYAKLKIFYVGMTGDKRLFTKQFSDKLLATLPYVPVVAYYDEEDEDFRGHNLSVQYIYGIVPPDTKIEYIEEDGKEYAICDVLLYTGRRDRTGEIAQKIVGKGHSLELNPADTKYKYNKNASGHIQSIEFTEGSLLGLSVLGDNEKPAFAGSEFFSAQSEFMKMFADFKATMIDIFAAQNQQRGDEMSVELENQNVIDNSDSVDDENLDATIIDETINEENQSDSQSNDTEGAEFDSNSEDENQNEENVDNENENDENFDNNEDDSTDEDNEPTREERFMEAFMKVTYDEIQDDVLSAFYSAFGDYVFVVQWSPFDNVLVYFDFENGKYQRVNFEQVGEGEDKTYSFSEPVAVKPRFLTEEEINTVFVQQSDEENEGTNEQDEQSSEEEDNFNAQEQQEETTEESQEESSQAALNQSEREELEAFRKEKKSKLIDSFVEDLSKDFIDGLRDGIDTHSFDELEVILSKEFTRMTRENRQQKPTNNTFIYNGETRSKVPQTEEEIVADLIARYKNN